MIGSPKSTYQSENGFTKWSKPTPYCKGFKFINTYSCMEQSITQFDLVRKIKVNKTIYIFLFMKSKQYF